MKYLRLRLLKVELDLVRVHGYYDRPLIADALAAQSILGRG